MPLSELQPSCVASLHPQLSLLLGTTQTVHTYYRRFEMAGKRSKYTYIYVSGYCTRG